MPARILVVDDDALACELICEILGSASIDASFLTNSAAAAKLLKLEKYHAVFLDMHMPPPDGVELAQLVRSSRLNASTVLVMITGEQDRKVMARAFEAGVEFLLFKPIERNKLLRLIHVAERSIERERRRFTRVRLRCRILLQSANYNLEGTTLDISLGGALVQSLHSLPSGTPVTVSLELEAGAPPIHSGARVVRTVGTDCMGIQFENFGLKEGARLQEYLLPLILSVK